MYRNGNIQKIALLLVGMMFSSCQKDSTELASADAVDLCASIDTRAIITKSDFSDLKLYYPLPTTGYDTLDITNMITINSGKLYFLGANNDFFWSDVNSSETSQLFLVGKYQGNEVWGQAIEGTTSLSNNYYKHKTLNFNTLEYRYSALTIVVQTKSSSDVLDGSLLRLSFSYYKPTPGNGFLKRQVESSSTDTITNVCLFSGNKSSYSVKYSTIPEQSLTELTRYLTLSYGGIDYQVDLQGLRVNRNETDGTFKYIAGESLVLTISINPSFALTPTLKIDTGTWDFSSDSNVQSYGNLIGGEKTE